ncbi:MAG: hypothetical protein FJZ92_11570 [Chloroflexi bacterium]|nr:hypothetical protein [Chloroflexota bacterium]
MTASVVILIDAKPDVLLLPSSAVRRASSTTTVLVPGAGGVAETRTVTVGASNGTQIEITSGLGEGDTVLIPATTTATSATAGATPKAGQAGQGFGGFQGGGGGGGGLGGIR